MATNEFGQPVGHPVTFTRPALPEPVVLSGKRVQLRPLETGDASDLLNALQAGAGPEQWTYMPVDPCADPAEMTDVITTLLNTPALLPFAIVVDGKPCGMASLMRCDPAAGSVEIGWIMLGQALRRAPAATEAMYLFMKYAFDLGYRRYEWKCDALNEPSRNAALRLGFRYEGTFRNALVYKGRNRDTAWFSVTDAAWPAVRAALEAWLDPDNFDDAGQQKKPLACLR